MRLLNTRTYKLQEFVGSDIPEYAILSHTWAHEEVLFQDIQCGHAASRAGFRKLQNFCRMAKNLGYQYAWMDTCCIDKGSSAELQESINSMSQWYARAGSCMIYLSDVDQRSEFEQSRWFKRGWTLQELIASHNKTFYKRDWTVLGMMRRSVQFAGYDVPFGRAVSQITKIPYVVLSKGRSLDAVSIAQKMSWVSRRETTRAEDMAYCLFGLFGVNMPLLYGEGEEKAFLRLQQEIMKDSDDMSLLAWKHARYHELESNTEAPLHLVSPDLVPPEGTFQVGLLAKSPSWFFDSSDVVPSQRHIQAEPYALSNMGLRISLPLIRMNVEQMLFLAVLDASISTAAHTALIGIVLQQLSFDKEFTRVSPGFFPIESSHLFSRRPDIYGDHGGLQRVSLYIRQTLRTRFAGFGNGFPLTIWLSIEPWMMEDMYPNQLQSANRLSVTSIYPPPEPERHRNSLFPIWNAVPSRPMTVCGVVILQSTLTTAAEKKNFGIIFYLDCFSECLLRVFPVDQSEDFDKVSRALHGKELEIGEMHCRRSEDFIKITRDVGFRASVQSLAPTMHIIRVEGIRLEIGPVPSHFIPRIMDTEAGYSQRHLESSVTSWP